MTDVALPPKPRRVTPTRRTELRADAERLEELDRAGLTLFGLPIERTGDALTQQQIITSARKFHQQKAAQQKRKRGKPKQRCI